MKTGPRGGALESVPVTLEKASGQDGGSGAWTGWVVAQGGSWNSRAESGSAGLSAWSAGRKHFWRVAAN